MIREPFDGSVQDVAPMYGSANVPAPLPPVQKGASAPVAGSKTSSSELSSSPDGCAPPADVTTSEREVMISSLLPSSWFVTRKLHSSGEPTKVGSTHVFANAI